MQVSKADSVFVQFYISAIEALYYLRCREFLLEFNLLFDGKELIINMTLKLCPFIPKRRVQVFDSKGQPKEGEVMLQSGHLLNS